MFLSKNQFKAGAGHDGDTRLCVFGLIDTGNASDNDDDVKIPFVLVQECIRWDGA
jgi:hypothetical protein